MITHLAVFKRNIMFYAACALGLSFYAFSLGSWVIGILALIYAFIVSPAVYFVARRNPLFFDIACISF